MLPLAYALLQDCIWAGVAHLLDTDFLSAYNQSLLQM